MPASLLLIHTDTDDWAMYAEYLRGCGFRVVETSTTDTAQTLIAASDVVITDLFVPGSIGGVELIRDVRSRWSSNDKPLIVVTGYIVTEMRELVQQAGCDVVLTKPCFPDVLLAEVLRLLGSSRTSTGDAPH